MGSKQPKPCATPDQAAVVGLLRTADILRRHISSVVEPHGITLQQYNVLRILRGAGAAGLPTLDVAARMIEQAPGITRLMDRLEAKTLVRRVRCPRDRRQVLGYITPRGLSLLGALDPLVSGADKSAMEGLKRTEVLHLIRLLDAARNGHTLSQSSN